jgi:hypothetical protein
MHQIVDQTPLGTCSCPIQLFFDSVLFGTQVYDLSLLVAF